MTSNILFADNDASFLNTRSEFLESAGYYVFKAATLSEAEWLLKNANIHVAILDIRMQNDDDEYDKSGLTLARQVTFRSIPKIILTDYAYYDAVREALREQPGRFKPAIDIIKKEDGPEALIAVIKSAFDEIVRINWNLAIDWKARDQFSLARLIESNLESERLLHRAEEFVDLFRRLFYESEHIRIERLLWERDGRVALVVLAFKEGAQPESFVVVCGQNAIVNEEEGQFNKFAPNAPSETGTRLDSKAETTHFAANAYAFASNDLENVQTLSELYRIGPPKVFGDSLTALFHRTLRDWHQDKLARALEPLESIYRQRLELGIESPSVANIEKAMDSIENQIVTKGVQMERADGRTNVRFKNRDASYPDPLSLLHHTIQTSVSTLIINVPGTLTGDNILADDSGHTWLTDFASAGQAPLFWNFVELESVIRFDWVETNDLLRRQELEHCLINTDFAKPDLRDLEPSVKKHARTISILRKMAARMMGKDVQDYHLGIYFHAARRLADYRPESRLTAPELTRLAHACLAMAMIAEKIAWQKGNDPAATVTEASELHILDETARIIRVENQKMRLPPQPFALLKYLYGRANQVCTKEELLRDVLQDKYEENYLHTLIGRIRKAIEDDVEQPRYLITETNAGYRLIPRPE